MKNAIVFRDDITIKIDEGGVAFTLGARDFKGVQCVCQSFNQIRYAQYDEDDIAATIKANGADYGGQ